ncbi:1-deoxy-D-xylulose-5-phosphate reductoisomerase [Candidatus Pelagibacter sp.]|nr:1-deoxy-D-xylulose-5-phosphate reductoisomerase [Candidatus Pelagibacter sp.]MDC0997197.1 1-deoxy-D-xylulose-5-phosphate reductoisomerase [Candidatus Pelagibacter sp.]
MKKKIAILGSTGSIGKTLFNILLEEQNNCEVLLLTAHKSHKVLLKQAKVLNVKNLIITNKKDYKILKDKTKKTKIRVFNNFKKLDKIFKKKIDYVMSSISGIKGLEPTVKIIEFTKKIAIANKESIICGWNLIQAELKKNNTEFIPVDSEHFSIWYGLKNFKKNNLEKVILTASGGPFYKTTVDNFKRIKVSDALKHPNWSMGKKISTDSATMINKVFEVMEARKVFDIDYKKIKILIHPKSYIHAILKFNNGLTNIIVHDTTMKVPIFNTLFLKENRKLKTNKININILNNLNLNNVNPAQFPMIKLLSLLPDNHSLFETVIVAANDKLVELFLNNKIQFIDIQKNLFKIIKKKEFQKFKKKLPVNIKDITNLNDYVRLKIDENNI